MLPRFEGIDCSSEQPHEELWRPSPCSVTAGWKSRVEEQGGERAGWRSRVEEQGGGAAWRSSVEVPLPASPSSPAPLLT